MLKGVPKVTGTRPDSSGFFRATSVFIHKHSHVHLGYLDIENKFTLYIC